MPTPNQGQKFIPTMVASQQFGSIVHSKNDGQSAIHAHTTEDPKSTPPAHSTKDTKQ
ncbi:hypothetical protein MKX01_001597, partial [Papaver californicum]